VLQLNWIQCGLFAEEFVLHSSLMSKDSSNRRYGGFGFLSYIFLYLPEGSFSFYGILRFTQKLLWVRTTPFNH
jgi:hypothetical protein